MGVDYAIARGSCLEFIDLHKWALVEDAGHCLIAAHGLVHKSYQESRSQLIPNLSSQPVVPVLNQQVLKALEGFIPHQPYIAQLLPYVHRFLTTHQNHFLFLTCDINILLGTLMNPNGISGRRFKLPFSLKVSFFQGI